MDRETKSNMRMKLALLFIVASVCARAQFTPFYQFTDFGLNPQGIKLVTMTPQWTINIFGGTNYVPGLAISQRTVSSGLVAFTNTIPGSYQIQFFGASGNVFTFTNYFGTNVTGYVNAANPIYFPVSTNISPYLYAYSQAASDAKYLTIASYVANTNSQIPLLSGTNIAVIPIGGSNQINFTGILAAQTPWNQTINGNGQTVSNVFIDWSKGGGILNHGYIINHGGSSATLTLGGTNWAIDLSGSSGGFSITQPMSVGYLQGSTAYFSSGQFQSISLFGSNITSWGQISGGGTFSNVSGDISGTSNYQGSNIVGAVLNATMAANSSNSALLSGTAISAFVTNYNAGPVELDGSTLSVVNPRGNTADLIIQGAAMGGVAVDLQSTPAGLLVNQNMDVEGYVLGTSANFSQGIFVNSLSLNGSAITDWSQIGGGGGGTNNSGTPIAASNNISISFHVGTNFISSVTDTNGVKGIAISAVQTNAGIYALSTTGNAATAGIATNALGISLSVSNYWATNELAIARMVAATNNTTGNAATATAAGSATTAAYATSAGNAATATTAATVSLGVTNWIGTNTAALIAASPIGSAVTNNDSRPTVIPNLSVGTLSSLGTNGVTIGSGTNGAVLSNASSITLNGGAGGTIIQGTLNSTDMVAQATQISTASTNVSSGGLGSASRLSSSSFDASGASTAATNDPSLLRSGGAGNGSGLTNILQQPLGFNVLIDTVNGNDGKGTRYGFLTTNGYPFASISNGIAAALPGDTIQLTAGTFYIQEGNPLYIPENCTLRGKGSHVSIIMETNVQSSSAFPKIVVFREGDTLQDFGVIDTNGTRTEIPFCCTTNNLYSLTNILIKDCYAAAYSDGFLGQNSGDMGTNANITLINPETDSSWDSFNFGCTTVATNSYFVTVINPHFRSSGPYTINPHRGCVIGSGCFKFVDGYVEINTSLTNGTETWFGAQTGASHGAIVDIYGTHLTMGTTNDIGNHVPFNSNKPITFNIHGAPNFDYLSGNSLLSGGATVNFVDNLVTGTVNVSNVITGTLTLNTTTNVAITAFSECVGSIAFTNNGNVLYIPVYKSVP
jgi:hypothetical protein